MFRNICLIGLPYSGKSVIGQKLYKHLNKGFVDTDDVIRQMYNCSLPTLIKNVGHKNFLDIESKVIKALNFQNVVLATGGVVKVICEPDIVKSVPGSWITPPTETNKLAAVATP